RVFQVSVPTFIDVPVGRIASVLAPLGLVTLGAQIATVDRIERWSPLILSSVTRLLIGPAIGFGLAYAFGLSGMIAQALVVSSSVPTAINTALLSIEFDNEKNFAAQAVMLSTLLSIVTVSVVIAVAQVVFPL
ncbi:MAG: AEC family transporter, partial [Candidatus Poribacteria bacterium]|nr:AEC family transporter [Candidatus Poribacteria bacterium]